jgi:ATP-binding cassette subfamily F protein 3
MDSIEALTTAIQNFDGSVIIVTHSEELLRRVCDRLIIFAQSGARYFDGGYDDFLEKIGWEEEEEQSEKVKVAPKSNNKENKKLKAELVRERNKLTLPLKKKVDKLEAKIMQLEESLELHHQELIKCSNSGDSASLMELSKKVSEEEKEVEKLFEEFEEFSMELEEINEGYEAKIEEVS